MYNPKDIFTKDGYVQYLAHIQNIETAINYIHGHTDDLHLGALDTNQLDLWYQFVATFDRLKPILENGDGETD